MRLLAWSLAGVFAALSVATVAIVAASGIDSDEWLVLFQAGFVVVGCLIAAREPENLVGWLLAGVGVAFALNAFSETYVAAGYDFGRAAIGWWATWWWFAWFAGAAIFLPLVFPHGRLLSRRWRGAVWLGVAACALSALGTSLKPGSLGLDGPPLDNPLGLSGAGAQIADAAVFVGSVLTAAAFMLSAASLGVRFRRSRGVERQQLKWLTYVGVLAAISLFVALLSALVNGQEGEGAAGTLGAVGWFSALALVILGIPLGTGIAILRHRLYDIDVVINRTLVYGALTATLAATYLASVLMLGLALGDSSLTVAISTLAVAALFGPARARIQAIVDRRFYRRRYDARRTLESFAARVRDEVDLDALSAELRAVVGESMQPAHVSLWLRRTT